MGAACILQQGGCLHSTAGGFHAFRTEGGFMYSVECVPHTASSCPARPWHGHHMYLCITWCVHGYLCITRPCAWAHVQHMAVCMGTYAAHDPMLGYTCYMWLSDHGLPPQLVVAHSIHGAFRPKAERLIVQSTFCACAYDQRLAQAVQGRQRAPHQEHHPPPCPHSPAPSPLTPLAWRCWYSPPHPLAWRCWYPPPHPPGMALLVLPPLPSWHGAAGTPPLTPLAWRCWYSPPHPTGTAQPVFLTCLALLVLFQPGVVKRLAAHQCGIVPPAGGHQGFKHQGFKHNKTTICLPDSEVQ